MTCTTTCATPRKLSRATRHALRAALALAALSSLASTALARPHPRGPVHTTAGVHKVNDHAPPLRVVVEDARTHARFANCLFSTVELPERAGASTPQRDTFSPGEPIWARCYLPDRPGTNRPGDLVDVITIDGKPTWEQAYKRALPSDAYSRLVQYGDLLRNLLQQLPPGRHRVEIEGQLRRGKRPQKLYVGAFGYVR